jgi:hypothetical protein
MAKILEGEKEKFDLRQKLDLMSHKELCDKFIEADKLLNRAMFVLEEERYESLPLEIRNFLKDIEKENSCG